VPGYRLTKAASDDIAHIYLAGLGLFGLTEADKYHAGLTAAFEFLVSCPRIARLREEIDPPVRACPCQSHLTVYELETDDTIITLRVRHGREDWMSDEYEE
jgi:toxin ParE1/3/4